MKVCIGEVVSRIMSAQWSLGRQSPGTCGWNVTAETKGKLVFLKDRMRWAVACGQTAVV